MELSRSEASPATDLHVLCERWWTARKPGAALPSYEDVALGNLGRLADRTAVVQSGPSDLTIVRMAASFASWLHGPIVGGVR